MSHAMQQTSHLNPLPSTEARDGSGILREARPRHQHVIAVIIVVSRDAPEKAAQTDVPAVHAPPAPEPGLPGLPRGG